MTNPTSISFVRHGHVHNPENIVYGRLPGFRLSDLGRRGAQAHLNCGRRDSRILRRPSATAFPGPISTSSPGTPTPGPAVPKAAPF